MADHGGRLRVKAAQLYHLQGLNQDQIGRQLGVSRSRVSRMLKEAREHGLIEISIHYPARFALELEQQLEAELGLREAVVVNTSSAAADQVLGTVAGAAAEYLLRVLQPGDILGVSGGETVATTAQVMPAAAVTGVSVAQLGAAVASLGDGRVYSSAEVALQLAQKPGGADRLILIPVPFLLDTPAIRDALLGDRSIREALKLVSGCTVALVGIGTLNALAAAPDASAAPASTPGPESDGRRCRRLLPLTAGEIAELRHAGAVGEICARFFDTTGRPSSTSLDSRMVGLDLAQLRSVPLVVGVACGPQKAPAILGAIRGGYLNTLVTDDLTATEVLAKSRSHHAGARGPDTHAAAHMNEHTQGPAQHAHT